MLSDTHPKIEAMMVEGYRAMTMAQKFARIQALNETVLQMAAARIKDQYGEMAERDSGSGLFALARSRHDDPRLWLGSRRTRSMSLAEPIAVLLELTAVLDDLYLRYLVGGSVASSLQRGSSLDAGHRPARCLTRARRRRARFEARSALLRGPRHDRRRHQASGLLQRHSPVEHGEGGRLRSE
jgi:hypothetical protein